MHRSTLAKVALSAVVLVGGAGVLVYSSASSAQHYKMVDDLISSGHLDQWKGKEMKVHGWVQAGSIVESVVNQETRRTFVLQKGGKTIRVFSTGPKPDTFKDQSEVVATGRLVPAKDMEQVAVALCKTAAPGMACPVRADAENAWVVDSTELMAKCPSKYDGAVSNKLDTQFK